MNKIILLLFLTLLSFSANAAPYSREDIKTIVNHADEPIKEYCKKIQFNQQTCFRLTKNKLVETFSIYKEEPYGAKFLKHCEERHLEKHKFNLFFDCMDQLLEDNSRNTPNENLNYLLLLPKEYDNLINNFCNRTYTEINIYRTDQCNRSQREAFGEFKRLWFSSETNQLFRRGFNNCLPDYLFIDENENIIIDFDSTINCMRQ